MSLDVINKIKMCERCVHWKSLPVHAAPLVNIQASQPLEVVCMAFLSVEPNGRTKYILVMTDLFHKVSETLLLVAMHPHQLLKNSWLQVQWNFKNHQTSQLTYLNLKANLTYVNMKINNPYLTLLILLELLNLSIIYLKPLVVILKLTHLWPLIQLLNPSRHSNIQPPYDNHQTDCSIQNPAAHFWRASNACSMVLALHSHSLSRKISMWAPCLQPASRPLPAWSMSEDIHGISNLMYHFLFRFKSFIRPFPHLLLPINTLFPSRLVSPLASTPLSL